MNEQEKKMADMFGLSPEEIPQAYTVNWEAVDSIGDLVAIFSEMNFTFFLADDDERLTKMFKYLIKENEVRH